MPTLRHVRIDGFPESSDDLFEFTIKGLLAQGGPSFVQNPMGHINCRYRSIREGITVACAAGLWIPDKDYFIGMENRPFLTIAHHMGEKWTRPMWRGGLDTLRKVHDYAAVRHIKYDVEWSESLRKSVLDVQAQRIKDDIYDWFPQNWEEHFN